MIHWARANRGGGGCLQQPTLHVGPHMHDFAGVATARHQGRKQLPGGVGGAMTAAEDLVRHYSQQEAPLGFGGGPDEQLRDQVASHARSAA